MLVAVAGDFAVTVRQMPQRKLFCGGQLVDYKRRQVCCDGEVTSGGGTALPDKTYGFVLRLRRSGRLEPTEGAPAFRHRCLSRSPVTFLSPVIADLPCGTRHSHITIFPAIPHYALRIPH